MSFPVASFCGYMCNRVLPWRQEDWNSYKWVQALKGKQLNGYAYVPVSGVLRRLNNANLASAVDWFGTKAASYVAKAKLKGPFLIVPVPNSKCVSTSTVRPNTKKLATALCAALNEGSTVLDCLRWKKDLGPAHEDGGSRDPAVLHPNLVILEDQLKGIDTTPKVLLVDDCTTSGGHLRACVAKLKSKKLKTAVALCGGKTIYDQDHPAFCLYEETLEDYEP